ncbi:MAG: type II secretion system F family protein, partial [Octadecabacter sp.]
SQGTDKLDKYSNFLEPQDKEEYSAIRLKLIQAGYNTKSAVKTYHFTQFSLGIVLLILGIAYAIYNSTTGDPSTKMTVGSILGPGMAGYYLPRWWVNKRQGERQEDMINGFPDSLDMMLVCVEAGQSLDQSIIRVSQELKAGYPALAGEYETVSNEMKAGKDKTQVLRDMSERAGVPDIASFVTVLIQSQQFGTSISEALRVFSAEMRDKRVMRAEEKANTLPTKMTLATMMLTVPPLLIILIGPSIYNIYVTLQASNF